ncbi:MAG: D-glycero-beta-D-manno-heptose-7-phosphate kinase [Phycisphaerales bacterium]
MSLLQTLSNWRPFRVLVVGDFMLDQLVKGDAERLTADAPVPVLHVRSTEEMPGGAANVCLDLRALHGDVRALGVVGDDHDGRLLRELLEREGVDASGLVADPTRPTTVKRNLVGLAQHRHPQKMFRVDFESREPIAKDAFERLCERVRASMQWADVVAIEDYGKGVCSEAVCRAVIEAAREAGVPVLVDPAATADYTKYAGCSAITPNRTEAERATGALDQAMSDDERAPWMAHTLRDRLACDAVVLTLDKEGAWLLDDQGGRRIPTQARQVYDVTGAGDMVLAALCAARANGLGWTDATVFANAAAGLEVEIFGVRPIPLERVHQSILTHGRPPSAKHRTLEEARVEVAAARREGRSVVFTNGCFDLLHAGHVSLLRKCAALGDVLVVGLNSDASVTRLKGPERPVHTIDDRVEVLSELMSVSLIVVFDEDTPERTIEALRPDVLVKGADYRKEDVVGGAFVESYGGRVELVDLLEGRSTTGAISRIRSGAGA